MSEVARRWQLCPQQVFRWRREARVEQVASAVRCAPAFVPMCRLWRKRKRRRLRQRGDQRRRRLRSGLRVRWCAPHLAWMRRCWRRRRVQCEPRRRRHDQPAIWCSTIRSRWHRSADPGPRPRCSRATGTSASRPSACVRGGVRSFIEWTRNGQLDGADVAVGRPFVAQSKSASRP